MKRRQEISLLVPRASTVLRLLVLLAVISTTSVAQSWYNSSWLYRKKITIDYTKVGSTGAPHNNFPVLISLSSDVNLSSNARSDGYDILFTSDDWTTKLNHGREKYSNGTLIAWVQVPSLSASSNTVLYLYFGNSGAVDQQTRTGIWDSNYKAVWHYDEGSGTSLGDATSNENTGTFAASPNTPTWSSSGKIGNALSFDGRGQQ